MIEKTIKLLRVIREEGLLVAITRARSYLSMVTSPLLYKFWVLRYDRMSPFLRLKVSRRIAAFALKPKISIVMPVYNPRPSDFSSAIMSVRKQVYPFWELCIADDASTNPSITDLLSRCSVADDRIKVIFRPENGHISEASNSALELVTGEFVVLMDHDDLLSPLALFYVIDALNNNPDAELLYSDEDKIDSRGTRHSPYFKPDWSEDLFLSYNYLNHLGVIKAELLRDVGGFRTGFEGAQDYDLFLRCLEKVARENICHIPRILYHWRAVEGSTALEEVEKPYALLAGQSAIQEYLHRTNVDAVVETVGHTHYRVRYRVPTPSSKVSIIIPTRNFHAYLKVCIDSLLEKTTYKNYEIIVIDNGSCCVETLEYLNTFRNHPRIKVLRDDSPFNFSRLNNLATDHATGEVFVLMNNDVEVLTAGWLEEMVSLVMRPEIGVVGARLWYADDTLQHGGVVLGIGGFAGHSHRRLPKGEPGYFRRAELLQNFSAVTGACLAVRSDVYAQVGGLDESLPVSFNDIDFCIKVHNLGYRNLWTPYAELYHYESISRGYDLSPEKSKRLIKEGQILISRYNELIKNDPFYNPNLTIEREDFSLAWPPRFKSI